jgi:tRNA (guanosine-2'-O-)-methyltransferase
MKTERRLNRLKAALALRQPDLTIVLENIHDPHNVSAIMRSCDATGVMRINMIYTVEKVPKIGKKTSASAFKWVDRRSFKTVDECYDKLHDEGFRIYATYLEPDSASIYDVDLTERVALVFGNEHRGVSDKAAQDADGRFKIPMLGMVQSLNVSVACAVTLYEAMRQRETKGSLETSKLNKQTLSEILDRWTKK